MEDALRPQRPPPPTQSPQPSTGAPSKLPHSSSDLHPMDPPSQFLPTSSIDQPRIQGQSDWSQPEPRHENAGAAPVSSSPQSNQPAPSNSPLGPLQNRILDGESLILPAHALDLSQPVSSSQEVDSTTSPSPSIPYTSIPFLSKPAQNPESPFKKAQDYDSISTTEKLLLGQSTVYKSGASLPKKPKIKNRVLPKEQVLTPLADSPKGKIKPLQRTRVKSSLSREDRRVIAEMQARMRRYESILEQQSLKYQERLKVLQEEDQEIEQHLLKEKAAQRRQAAERRLQQKSSQGPAQAATLPVTPPKARLHETLAGRFQAEEERRAQAALEEMHQRLQQKKTAVDVYALDSHEVQYLERQEALRLERLRRQKEAQKAALAIAEREQRERSKSRHYLLVADEQEQEQRKAQQRLEEKQLFGSRVKSLLARLRQEWPLSRSRSQSQEGGHSPPQADVLPRATKAELKRLGDNYLRFAVQKASRNSQMRSEHSLTSDSSVAKVQTDESGVKAKKDYIEEMRKQRLEKDGEPRRKLLRKLRRVISGEDSVEGKLKQVKDITLRMDQLSGKEDPEELAQRIALKLQIIDMVRKEGL